jgi:hypothetical protein
MALLPVPQQAISGKMAGAGMTGCAQLRRANNALLSLAVSVAKDSAIPVMYAKAQHLPGKQEGPR